MGSTTEHQDDAVLTLCAAAADIASRLDVIDGTRAAAVAAAEASYQEAEAVAKRVAVAAKYWLRVEYSELYDAARQIVTLLDEDGGQ
jgi:hypothetical protein